MSVGAPLAHLQPTYNLPTTYYLLPTTYYLLLTTYLQAAASTYLKPATYNLLATYYIPTTYRSGICRKSHNPVFCGIILGSCKN